MDRFMIKINGIEIMADRGSTILDAARSAEIEIPTLCFDERMEIYGGCGICVVEVAGMPKPVKACSTKASEGMEVFTDTERVLELRKTNLELLISNHTGDCRPPCMLGCPANTDCQGYVGLVANGMNKAALKLIKDKIPLPASIGRVCPHPCESKCRRGLVDEPIAIAEIKRFAADQDLLNSEEEFIPQIPDETGKKVAVIGGGPYGLSMAYFLRQFGHAITIYDAMPKAGGMLRYGIPQYRLPKEILDKEIEIIGKMGVEFNLGVKIGEDISFEKIREDYDAVCVGIGAWKSSPVGCKGENAGGVYGGIYFLRNVILGKETGMGKNVAVIGGGNTAMDACRTAVRLGAENVYNVYRRTVDEMPADKIEIKDALEEGVIFKNLVAPEEIIADENGRVCKLKLQVMELGEAGADGRRKPIPVQGQFIELEVDTVIGAIGQAVEGEIFPQLDQTKKKSIRYDAETFRANLEGVFVGGDCGNDKISIAVEAIADAQKSAALVDSYLKGKDITYRKEFTVERNDLTPESFEDRERMLRQQAEVVDKEIRKGVFDEVAFTFTPEQAMKEASRCLECGCQDYFECKLIAYSNELGIDRIRFAGDKTVESKELFAEKPCCEEEQGDDEKGTQEIEPYIIRDNKKCILCGRCVRVCHDMVGAGAIGLVDRGFDTTVEPELCNKLEDTDCIACGQCIAVCPTGALREGRTYNKPIPLNTEMIKTTCGFCPLGCSVYKEVYEGEVIRIIPNLHDEHNQGIICNVGKFGFIDLLRAEEAEEEEADKASCEDKIQCDGEVINIEGDTITALVEALRKLDENIVIGIIDNASNEDIAEAKEACSRLNMKLVGIRDDYKDSEPLFAKYVELMNQRRSRRGLAEYPLEELMKGCNAAGLRAAGIEYGDEYEADVMLPYGNWLNKKGSIINIDGNKRDF